MTWFEHTVAADSPRILELRRRVQADPASIAFAQLAEECRRAGANEEAVGICRAGLGRHPDYLSARVTLGRALIELGQLDDANRELDLVVATAPDNLPAIRGLAEIHQRRGQMSEALTFYRRALTLASSDPDLRDTVGRISRAVEPAAPSTPAPPAVPVEELFDFDKLLEQLGLPVQQVPEVSEVPKVPEVPGVPKVLEESHAPRPIKIEVPLDETDTFADLERELRAMDEQRARDEQAARRQVVHRRQQTVLNALTSWLAAIVADRSNHSRV